MKEQISTSLQEPGKPATMYELNKLRSELDRQVDKASDVLEQAYGASHCARRRSMEHKVHWTV